MVTVASKRASPNSSGVPGHVFKTTSVAWNNSSSSVMISTSEVSEAADVTTANPAVFF